MASGYLNDAALTAQRFVQAAGGGTLCRTGDLGRFNSLGELEVLGRIDRQVKLHGIRIELGEIEAVLRKVCQDVVVVPCAEDDQTLVVSSMLTGLLRQHSALQRRSGSPLPGAPCLGTTAAALVHGAAALHSPGCAAAAAE